MSPRKLTGGEMSTRTSLLKIKRISGDKVERVKDAVIKERPVTVMFNEDELATFMCSPADLDSLAVGFLFSEGLVRSKKDIKRIAVDERESVVWVETAEARELPEGFVARRFITTGCGKGLTFVDSSRTSKNLKVSSEFTIESSCIPALAGESLRKSQLFRTTGGTHSAALCSPKKILVFKEDIGRHSAIDKVVGHCVLNGIRTEDRILVTSGRVSSEILVKAARSRIPVVISKSAPTDLAIRLAEDLQIALVGFARGMRMNIYSNDWRILTKKRDRGKRNE
jgi:FdhD protein